MDQCSYSDRAPRTYDTDYGTFRYEDLSQSKSLFSLVPVQYSIYYCMYIRLINFSQIFFEKYFLIFVKIAFLMWSLVGQKFDWKRWSVFGEREMKRPRLSSENDSLLIISKENLSFRPLWETKNYERSFWVNSEGLRSLPVVNQKVFCKNERP